MRGQWWTLCTRLREWSGRGAIIALIALGLSITSGLLEMINVAQGDFFMLGTVIGLVLTTAAGNFWIAIVLVPLIGFALGMVLERLIIRPTIWQATVAVSSRIWGNPSAMSRRWMGHPTPTPLLHRTSSLA
jgi:ABC-type branched-subunit amino acid transport system permease subunit